MCLVPRSCLLREPKLGWWGGGGGIAGGYGDKNEVHLVIQCTPHSPIWINLKALNNYQFILLRKKEIDKMLMEMIENQEKSTEDEKEQENGSSEMNGVDQEESEQEDEETSEVGRDLTIVSNHFIVNLNAKDKAKHFFGQSILHCRAHGEKLKGWSKPLKLRF